MKMLNIKESRKKLNLTQEQLARKLGVSRKTLISYENGGVIPETKRELLLTILSSDEDFYNLKEPASIYQKISGYEQKINQLREEIETRRNIIRDSKDEDLIQHQTKMIELIELQINEIEKAQHLHLQK